MDDDDTGRSRRIASAGSLASRAGDHRCRRRGAGLALAAAALLAGVLLVRGTGGDPGSARAGASPAAAPSSAAPAPVVTGRRAFAVDSGAAAASIVVGAVRRVAAPSGSLLQLELHLDVWAGAETVTTETFTAVAPGGGPPVRASSVTVLRPGPRTTPSDGGFAISAPSSVDLVVILDVPPGQHRVTVIGAPSGGPLAAFTVRG